MRTNTRVTNGLMPKIKHKHLRILMSRAEYLFYSLGQQAPHVTRLY